MDGPVAGSVTRTELHFDSDASKVEMGYWSTVASKCEDILPSASSVAPDNATEHRQTLRKTRETELKDRLKMQREYRFSPLFDTEEINQGMFPASSSAVVQVNRTATTIVTPVTVRVADS
ncbi:unnamed protein product [Pleuronectes platessa]|uniref:Uncharacterized protein n=1 Tax=Pleuronectes platessa TaxID=8262 RepID=A0A9N7Z134_PLEPL|nr:unnamed protein product [Pleuronectes platessa]